MVLSVVQGDHGGEETYLNKKTMSDVMSEVSSLGCMDRIDLT